MSTGCVSAPCASVLLEGEALGELKVELHRAELPGAPQEVLHREVDLGRVEGALSRVRRESDAVPLEHAPKRGLRALPGLGVPTRLLTKNGPLTPEERRVIELHPEYGHEMVRGISFLGEARAAVLHHHERLDGTGYPYGLAGGQIPESARVVAVADAFDAMTSTRSYSRARPVPVALEELRRCAGAHFDPRMVAALVRAIGRSGWHPAVTADEAHPAPVDTWPTPDGTRSAAGAPGPVAGGVRSAAGDPWSAVGGARPVAGVPGPVAGGIHSAPDDTRPVGGDMPSGADGTRCATGDMRPAAVPGAAGPVVGRPGVGR